MKKKMSLFFLALVSLFFQKADANAGCVDNYGIGAEAGSLGGAVTASIGGPFSVFYNPAGLAKEKGTTISGGAIVLNPLLKAEDYKFGSLRSEDFEDESDSSASPHLGFSTKLSQKFSFGIAAYSPYGLSLKWDVNTTVNPGAFNCYEAWYIREAVTPAIAYKVSDRLFIGAGVSLGTSTTGKKFISQGISSQVKQPVSLETDFTDHFNYSYNLGIMFIPNDRLSFGLAYRSRTDVNFDGKYKIKSPASIPFEKTEFDIELNDVDHPEQLQGGIRYSFNDKLSLNADLLWVHWSIVEKETIFFKNPNQQMTQLLHGNKKVYDRNWKDITQVKLGIEYKLNKIVSLRCGYFDDPSPIPDESFDLEWPGCSKTSYSIGAGFDFEKWSLDTVLIYAKSRTREIDSGESNNFDNSSVTGDVYTKASGSIFGLGLTLSYYF